MILMQVIHDSINNLGGFLLMKTTYYDLEITQKSDDNTFTISHSN